MFSPACARSTRRNTSKSMMKALQEHGLPCTRMGAYKPRTNPYSFQGHGKSCLPYVFELAGKYDIKVIAMEVTHDMHVQEIREALEADRESHRACCCRSARATPRTSNCSSSSAASGDFPCC